MSIEHRPEYRAAQIQAEADGRDMSPERLEYRETWRQRIAAIIAGKALAALDKLEGDPEREF